MITESVAPVLVASLAIVLAGYWLAAGAVQEWKHRHDRYRWLRDEDEWDL